MWFDLQCLKILWRFCKDQTYAHTDFHTGIDPSIELEWFPYWFCWDSFQSQWIVALGLLTSPRIFSFYSPRVQRVSAFKLLIVQCEVRKKISVKQEKVCSQDSWSRPWKKYLNPLEVFSFRGSQQKIRLHSRLYGRLCRTRWPPFCVQSLFRPQCYLSSFQLFQQKRGRFNCIILYPCS